MVGVDHPLLGLLRVRVLRGVNLAIRDLRSSDPYVVVHMGKQKLKTRVIKRNINPVWEEDLTLTVDDPNANIKLEVFDKDTFTLDDPMGYAVINIGPLAEAAKLNLKGVPNGTIIRKLIPNRQNCLAEESVVHVSEGKIVQDVVLRLKNVECGEIELQLQWIPIQEVKG